MSERIKEVIDHMKGIETSAQIEHDAEVLQREVGYMVERMETIAHHALQWSADFNRACGNDQRARQFDRARWMLMSDDTNPIIKFMQRNKKQEQRSKEESAHRPQSDDYKLSSAILNFIAAFEDETGIKID